ncbi:MAG: hypothetical protein WA919_02265 [Coleofasciculaceae cyanobacterium]
MPSKVSPASVPLRGEEQAIALCIAPSDARRYAARQDLPCGASVAMHTVVRELHRQLSNK